jgi:thiamine biosynthesis protein ThiI
VTEFCALDVRRPLTHVRAGELDQQEGRIDAELLERLVQRARVVPSRQFGTAMTGSPELDYVPEHAAVIDLRSEREYGDWHWPHAVHMTFDKAEEHVERLPADRAYLLYCEIGLKSAYLAEAMREAGFEAYSFRGGVQPLRRYAERVVAPDASPL